MSKSCSHPNIVNYYDFVEGSAHYFVIMERLDGEELLDRFLADLPVTEQYVRNVLRQVLEPLIHIHKLGYLYGIYRKAYLSLLVVDFYGVA
jgi:serine/threonine protein kinase